MMARTSSAVLRGKQNRAVGAMFEQMIDAACRYYRQAGIAEIDKTPEAMKPLGHQNGKGQFLACYTKKAQPDFKGTLKGGCSIVFEAKITSAEKMQQSVVLKQQAEALERHRKLGAQCFILISFSFQKFYRVPWVVWRDMKEKYGRKYIKPEDIPQYEVKLFRGMIDFLPEERLTQA
jgi:recombination protein U